MPTGVQVLSTLVVATLCFTLGGVNPATIIGRARGIDVAKVGSGNPGATNLGRTLGRSWGIVVGVLDVLKGLVPTLVVDATLGTTVALFAGLAVVLGHVYSPFLGGHGGKGVATSLGAVLALAPWVALAVIIVFAVALPFVERLGDASVIATGVLAGMGLGQAVTAQTGLGRGVGVWLVVLAALVLTRHRRNIAIWVGRLTG